MTTVSPVTEPPADLAGLELWPAAGQETSILRRPFRGSATQYLALAFALPAPLPLARPRLRHEPPAAESPVRTLVSCTMLCHWGILPQRARDGADAVLMTGPPEFDLILMRFDMPEADGLTATLLIQREGRKYPWSRGLADRHPPPRLSAFVLRCYYRAMR